MRHRELQSLLIRAGLVTSEVVERALLATAGTSTTWLEHLVQRKVVADDQVAALAGPERFVPLCDVGCLERVTPAVIALVPWDLAIEHRAVPIAFEGEGDLRIAMVDPCDVDAFAELEFFLGGHRLLREVAPATPVAWALHRYYGFRSALWPQQAARATTLRSQPALRAIQAAV
jgi:hypothetical protein